MFKDYGLNKQTPRTYYEKNDWTWARMQELADKFVKKNASKEIVQWGADHGRPVILSLPPVWSWSAATAREAMCTI